MRNSNNEGGPLNDAQRLDLINDLLDRNLPPAALLAAIRRAADRTKPLLGFVLGFPALDTLLF